MDPRWLRAMARAPVPGHPRRSGAPPSGLAVASLHLSQLFFDSWRRSALVVAKPFAAESMTRSLLRFASILAVTAGLLACDDSNGPTEIDLGFPTSGTTLRAVTATGADTFAFL